MPILLMIEMRPKGGGMMKRDDVIGAVLVIAALLAVMLWVALKPAESDPITHNDYPPCTVAAEEAGFC